MDPSHAGGALGCLVADRAAEQPGSVRSAVCRVTLEDLLAHQETVFLVCLGFTRRRAEAEDMTQETYLRAMTRVGQLREPASSKAWLCRIARNVCLDLLRRQRWQRFFSIGFLTDRSGGKPNPEQILDSKERGLAAKEAIARLPRKLREVFVLRAYGELSYDEVSVALGIRRGTVMSRLHRARKLLAKALEGKA